MLIVATLELELDHTPPEDGNNWVVPVIHIEDGPLMDAIGVALTVTGVDANELQPVVAFVNTNVVEPMAMPVTIPPFVMVAILGLLLVHVPPVVGLNVVVVPIHI